MFQAYFCIYVDIVLAFIVFFVVFNLNWIFYLAYG